MANQANVDRISEIREQMLDLLQEADDLTRMTIPDRYPNLSAYVFEQIREHLSKANPYNQDMEDVANAIEAEIVEVWEDEDHHLDGLTEDVEEDQTVYDPDSDR